MKIGTKSLLFGVHLWFLHPIFVAIAWVKLYGWYPDYPYRPFPRLDLLRYWLRLMLCFIVHDWSYWGKKEIDGPEGDTHPEVGARIAHSLLDKVLYYEPNGPHAQIGDDEAVKDTEWYKFCLYHSRFYAKRDGVQPSKLCMADKLAAACYPTWLFVFLATLTGEMKVYMDSARPGTKHGFMELDLTTPTTFVVSMQEYLRKYAFEHAHGKIDLSTQLQDSPTFTGQLTGIKADPLGLACVHAFHTLKGDGAIKDNMFGQSLPQRQTVSFDEIREAMAKALTDEYYILSLPIHIQEQMRERAFEGTVLSGVLDVAARAVLDMLVQKLQEDSSEKTN